MPLIRLWPSASDEFGGPATRAIDGDAGDSWWAGANLSFARVAIAGALTLTAVGAGLAQAATTQDQSEIVSPPPAVVVEDEAPAIVQWRGLANVLVPAWANEQNEQAAGLYGQPDEDFWGSGVAPVRLTFRVPDPSAFEQHDTVVASLAEFDEDFWNSGVAPAPLAFRPFDLWQLEQHENAAGLYGQPDEDAWMSGVAATSLSFRRFDPSQLEQPEIVAPPANQVDEDCWSANPLRVTTFATPAPWGFEQNESPPIVVLAPPNEDHWSSGVAPQLLAFRVPSPWVHEQHEQAAALHGQPDEDFWTSGVAPRPFVFRLLDAWGFDAAPIVPRLSIPPIYPPGIFALAAYVEATAATNLVTATFASNSAEATAETATPATPTFTAADVEASFTPLVSD